MAQPYQPQSFYETTLVAAITATQSTIAVTVAPTITSGYLVIEANTSNREIILYTGVTGTTLTGVTRGLAEYGSDDSGGTGKAHPAGVDIANKDVHFYFAQYYDFLTGTSATGSNTMRIGNGAAVSTADRFWYVNTSSVSGFWGLSSSGQMVVSEDGVTSYVISAGGSGVAGSNSVDITAGVASVKAISASELRLSSSGFRVSAGKLAINAGQGLSATSASELYVDLKHDYTWAGLHTFSGGLVSAPISSMTIGAANIVGTTTPQIVALSASNQLVVKADASNYAAIQAFGVVNTSADASSSANVILSGVVGGFTGLTAGSEYYLSDTAGEITTTQGTFIVPVGRAISTTQLLLNFGMKKFIGEISVSGGAAGDAESTVTTSVFQIGFSPISIKLWINCTISGSNTAYTYWEGTTRGRSTTLQYNTISNYTNATASNRQWSYGTGSSFAGPNPGGTNSGVHTLGITGVTDEKITFTDTYTTKANGGASSSWSVYAEISGY